VWSFLSGVIEDRTTFLAITKSRTSSSHLLVSLPEGLFRLFQSLSKTAVKRGSGPRRSVDGPRPAGFSSTEFLVDATNRSFPVYHGIVVLAPARTLGVSVHLPQDQGHRQSHPSILQVL